MWCHPIRRQPFADWSCAFQVLKPFSSRRVVFSTNLALVSVFVNWVKEKLQISFPCGPVLLIMILKEICERKRMRLSQVIGPQNKIIKGKRKLNGLPLPLRLHIGLEIYHLYSGLTSWSSKLVSMLTMYDIRDMDRSHLCPSYLTWPSNKKFQLGYWNQFYRNRAHDRCCLLAS